MSDYLTRNAGNADIPFLADLVIAAEKAGTDKLSFSTLFNITEAEAKNLIIAIFEEDIDGCEFSVSSYLIIEYKGKPVAGFGAWVEAVDGEMPSGLLKSNLIGFTFGKARIEYLKAKSAIIKDILAEREPQTLQLEYLFVDEEHRGKRLPDELIKNLEENALAKHPGLKKAQIQLYTNNAPAVRLYQRNGYEIVKTFRADNEEILDYLPFNEKCIMEKRLRN